MLQFTSWQEVWSDEVAEKRQLPLRVRDTGVIQRAEMVRQRQVTAWLVPVVSLCSRGCDGLLRWMLEALCTAAGEVNRAGLHYNICPGCPSVFKKQRGVFPDGHSCKPQQSFLRSEFILGLISIQLQQAC